MRIHGNQSDLNMQVNLLNAAAKAEEKKEAERVRKKLLDSASAFVSEEDDCVVKLSGESEPEEEADGQDQKQNEEADPEDEEDTFSGWA